MAIGLYDVFEVQVTNANAYSNKFDFTIIELRATFTAPSGRTVTFFGFHDGDGAGGQTGNIWKLRFMPDELGDWTYTFTWSDATPGGSGSFGATDTGLRGSLRIAGDNPWYFMDARGQRFHWRPYGMQHASRGAPSTSFIAQLGWFKDTFKTRCIDKGYNFTYWHGLSGRVLTGDPNAWDESWWLNTTDLRIFSVANFQAFEDALALAKNNNVYVLVWTGMVIQGEQYGFTDFQVFLRYWLARFAPFFNFLGWSPTWEWTDIWTAAQVNEIMQYLYDNDPWRQLLSIHDCANSNFGGWHGFSMRQAHSNDVFLGNSRTAGQQQGLCDSVGGVAVAFRDKPIIGSEDIWESTFSTMPVTAAQVRRAAWGIQMAGVMPLYSEWTPDPPPTGGNGAGEPEMRRLFDFLYSKTRYREYRQFNGLVSSAAGQICSAVPGQEYLVYDQDGGAITIDLSGAAAEQVFDVLWYNPATGEEQSGGTVNGGASRMLTSPFAGDSVLLLTVPVVTEAPFPDKSTLVFAMA